MIKSKEITLVDIDAITPHPKNNNRHSIEQIKRLEKLIKHNNFRVPLIVSKQSGFLIAGHGRLEAAKALDMSQVPVIYQDFENEAEEYQFLTADNAIQSWSELDMQAVYDEVEAFDTDFDIELLGIEKFTIEEEEKPKENKEVDLKFEYKIEVDCGDEEQQNYLTGELNDRGFKVRVLV